MMNLTMMARKAIIFYHFFDRMTAEEQVSIKVNFFCFLNVVDEKVEYNIETSDCLSLQFDSWTNIRNKGITNIMVGTPTQWLIDSFESQEQSQNN